MKSTRINLEVPVDFYRKVEFLCGKYHDVEWSGILLYEVTGSLEQPENIQITVKDIILMDIGTKGATSYNFQDKRGKAVIDRHIDYMMDHPDALSWKIGHIHSHNTMPVFFSGTDMDEVHENSPSHNAYLSLIVNNNNDYLAKVTVLCSETYRRTEVPLDKTINDFEGNVIHLADGASFSKEVKRETLHIYDVDISLPQVQPMYDSFFVNNVFDVDAQKKVVKTKAVAKTSSWIPTKNVNKSVKPGKKLKTTSVESINTYQADHKIISFLKTCFLGYSAHWETLVSTLEKMEAENIDVYQIYPERFDQCAYALFPEHFGNPEEFCELLKDCRATLKPYSQNSFVKQLLDVLAQDIKTYEDESE